MVALGARWVLRVRWAGRSYSRRLLSEFDFLGERERLRGSERGGCRGDKEKWMALRDLCTVFVQSFATQAGGRNQPDTRGRGAPRR